MKRSFQIGLLVIIIITCVPTFIVQGSKENSSQPALLSPVADHPIFFPLVTTSTIEGGWPMVAANPERTSWTPEGVSGRLQVEWYRPIEAYIPQHVQIIASDGLLFISTARGLYALDASNGEIAWRYDTEVPLGNSPTVDDGVVYVGGYDRKIHALNVKDGTQLWEFSGAAAGFSTNPLVVEGKVIAGNRDGYLYAIGAHGTSQAGNLIWKFQTNGMINLSAAYKDGVVYFASSDNFAYALKTSDGSLVWKSDKLPGDGYHSYWPVIYLDKVIFYAASGYRHEDDPGVQNVTNQDGAPYNTVLKVWLGELYANEPEGTVLGQPVPDQDWAHGWQVIDGSRITEYLEDNPNPDPHNHKPWRREVIVLNSADGQEYTFDSDYDGYREYLPVTYWGTRSGNHYPSIVGSDNNLYQSVMYQDKYGGIMGWNITTPSFLSVLALRGDAGDEPQALSAGGDIIYRSICCDRVGDWLNIDNRNRGSFWDYYNTLAKLAPGYDEMWWGIDPDGLPRWHGNYGNKNGIYHNHGDQNPIIPYNGRIYIHRSNTIIAYGPDQGPGKLPLLTITPVQDSIQTPTAEQFKVRLEDEIEKFIAAGHLRPGYYNHGQFSAYTYLRDYFDNPGDTLYTLASAYPHLNPQMQIELRAYLQSEFNTYFDPIMYSIIGWADGAAREDMPLPPEVQAALVNHPKIEWAYPNWAWSWSYPQHNFYGMWKYAQIFPQDAIKVYELAKSKLQVPVPSTATNEYLAMKPWEHNAYIAGYFGFLNLQELAGKSDEDLSIRTNVINELDRLLELRANNFTKDSPYVISETLPSEGGEYHKRVLNVSRNFIWLVPELGDYLNQHALSKVQTAITEYDYIAPYWFVARNNAVVNEGVMQSLYDLTMFQAKAHVLKAPQSELFKYLDVPAFARGDLFYIQNLITTIEAAE